MQKIFIDTEFTDFIGSQLISFGAVTEDGKHEFYVEITDYDTRIQSDFVKENIVPLLNHEKYGMTFMKASVALWTWLVNLPYEAMEISIDYHTDWELFKGLLFEDLPKNLAPQPHYLLRDLRLRGSVIDTNAILSGTAAEGTNYVSATTMFHYQTSRRKYFEQATGKQHNALVDAHANRHAWIVANNFLISNDTTPTCNQS